MTKKYITILCDGMADRPDAHGLTPMDEAHKPVMDMLCSRGLCGLVKTVPDGMKPGSDVCNIAALGYDPTECYTGRSPLEALSMGIPLTDSDVTFRVNLVTLSHADTFVDRTMTDYSAGEISSEEASELISALKPLFSEYGLELYAGKSYRHAAVIRGSGSTGTEFTPPHDIQGKQIGNYLPRGGRSEIFTQIIERSSDILKNHPVCKARVMNGKYGADAVWFWGEGKKPVLKSFKEMFGKTAAVISAVDLVKGIGFASGAQVAQIPSATGTVDTDYEAKTTAALDELETCDYCFLHFEGPDECGHQGDRKGKIAAIERIDARVLSPILKALENSGTPFAICIMPDHATPLSVRTHTSEPVPFLIYDSESDGKKPCRKNAVFSEKQAVSSGVSLPHGRDVIGILFGISERP